MKSQKTQEAGERTPHPVVVSQLGTAASISKPARHAQSSFDDLHARMAGFDDSQENLGTITVPRSTDVRIRFHNESDSPQRLTARLGTFGEEAEDVMCTTLINPGKEAFLSFKIPKTNAASSTPLELQVPGVEGQTIAIVVP